MNEIEFQCWLARSSNLSDGQKTTTVETIKSSCQANVYEILENMRPGRLCPHCKSTNCIKRGKVRNLQRYQCKSCRKTYNTLTGTSFSQLRHCELWLSYSSELIEGSSLRSIANRSPISKTTAFLWRHRFLQAPSLVQAQTFIGITEADETYFLESFKGKRHLARSPRRRGGRSKK